MGNSQPTLENFEIVKCGPYRFVGGCVYVGNKGYYLGGKGAGQEDNLSECIWNHSDWVFAMLNDLKEYASDEIHSVSLAAWDRYDEKNQLFGYYIGRFMQPGTPVPPDLDYFDVTAEYIAKAWWKGKRGEGLGTFWGGGAGFVMDEVNRTGLYKDLGWVWEAQVFPEPDENGETLVGAYVPCRPLTKKELKKKAKQAKENRK